jgi:hypothetical protein
MERASNCGTGSEQMMTATVGGRRRKKLNHCINFILVHCAPQKVLLVLHLHFNCASDFIPPFSIRRARFLFIQDTLSLDESCCAGFLIQFLSHHAHLLFNAAPETTTSGEKKLIVRVLVSFKLNYTIKALWSLFNC